MLIFIFIFGVMIEVRVWENGVYVELMEEDFKVIDNVLVKFEVVGGCYLEGVLIDG